ncbi:MAG: cob(I)yrinic acid a,c-diamide adenosyltransferase [Candidatus Hatepunaea meridiana]|nr:cob(I)yrinic acid a,c-diamide adenosyltransferase [Candidatus Hatepunaea meridiana]
MKIYTKAGDSGKTSLYTGGKVDKDSKRINAYGTIDELNSFFGWVRAHGLPEDQDKLLHKVQNDLFKIGSDLAASEDKAGKGRKIIRLSENAERFLEDAIDKMDTELPPLRDFIIPGGVPPAVALHVVRSICRRAERDIVALAKSESVNPQVLKYINRLSDMLFVMARYMNMKMGLADVVVTAD